MNAHTRMPSPEFHDPSLEDKLFFTKLPFFAKLGIMVEIGCGPHGHVHRAAAALNPALLAYGVDPAYHDLTVSAEHHRRGLTSDWAGFLELMRRCSAHYGADRALLFSSVLHEMFSPHGHYTCFLPCAFWEDVQTTGAEYVIVRDMSWTLRPGIEIDPSMAMELTIAMGQDVRDLISVGHLKRETALAFSNRTMGVRPECANTAFRASVEHALKCLQPQEHAEREYSEDYFALSWTPFQYAAAEAGYEVIHHEAYILPWVKQEVFPNLQYPPFTTHLKAVFRKR